MKFHYRLVNGQIRETFVYLRSNSIDIHAKKRVEVGQLQEAAREHDTRYQGLRGQIEGLEDNVPLYC